jgi:hypothetical protein
MPVCTDSRVNLNGSLIDGALVHQPQSIATLAGITLLLFFPSSNSTT